MWIKRLRKKMEPAKIRYYGIGEYGDRTQRPHYHAILFGVPGCAYGSPRFTRGAQCRCDPCQKIQSTWRHGLTYLGNFTHEAGQYVAKYTVKGMTKKTDQRLNGRPPEFSRMSLRPGIGADFVDVIRASLSGPAGKLYLERNSDVPQKIDIHGKSHPIGRYLAQKLRVSLGLSKNASPDLMEKLRLNYTYHEIMFDKCLEYRQSITQRREKIIHNYYNKQKGGAL